MRAMTARTRCQKAPSAIRCIKTGPDALLVPRVQGGQKAPSAIRCIKTAQKSSPATVK